MVEEIDKIARAADVAADGANGFRERTNLDVDAAVAVEVVDRAPAVSAQNT